MNMPEKNISENGEKYEVTFGNPKYNDRKRRIPKVSNVSFGNDSKNTSYCSPLTPSYEVETQHNDVKKSLNEFSKPSIPLSLVKASPVPPSPSANSPVKAPVPNAGFVNDKPAASVFKPDFYKNAEPKQAPSETPDEPLKTLTPAQQELEAILPVGANFACLPAKLSEKLSLTTCELCKVNMLHVVQSKMHYNGKPHMKKVRSFLIKECGKADEPVIKVAKIDFGRDLNEAESRECKICKVVFNSSVHANSHYEGKKHKKQQAAYERTGGIGGDGRFGIGSDFAPPPSGEPEKLALANQFYCKICNVQAGASDQYEQHIIGARHAKNLRKLNGTSGENSSSNNSKSESFNPYAMFRTPSGKFYCHYCDYNANTQKQFSIHVKTDSHAVKGRAFAKKEPEATGFDLTTEELWYEDY